MVFQTQNLATNSRITNEFIRTFIREFVATFRSKQKKTSIRLSMKVEAEKVQKYNDYYLIGNMVSVSLSILYYYFYTIIAA